MRWVRRIHLFSGMLMFPWALLYGITALLFNHPGCLSETERTRFEVRSEKSLPTARELAETVVSALKTEGHVGSAKLGRAEPRFTGRFLVKESSTKKVSFITLRPGEATAVATSRPRGRNLEEAPFAQKRWFPAGKLGDGVRDSIAHELSKRGSQGENTLVAGPRLRFSAVLDGEEWFLEYALNPGSLSGARSPRQGQGLRDLAIQLHMSYGFPGDTGPRFGWALLVDLMGLTMIFWALSGLAMCLHSGRFRRLGLAMFGVGIGIAAALIAWMAGTFG